MSKIEISVKNRFFKTRNCKFLGKFPIIYKFWRKNTQINLRLILESLRLIKNKTKIFLDVTTRVNHQIPLCSRVVNSTQICFKEPMCRNPEVRNFRAKKDRKNRKKYQKFIPFFVYHLQEKKTPTTDDYPKVLKTSNSSNKLKNRNPTKKNSTQKKHFFHTPPISPHIKHTL